VQIQILIRGSGRLNAIDTASALLADALSELGHDTETTKWTPGRLLNDSAGADLLVLPYNPFMWGGRGFAPRLLRDVVTLRRSRRRPDLVLVMHELYVPITDARSLVIGAWQRVQLGALIPLADRRFASIQVWANRLSRVLPTGHLPSGSNLPDARALRAEVRKELSIEELFVVGTLTTGHPSQLTSYVEAALSRLATEGVPTLYLQLGAGAADVRSPPSTRVERLGALPAQRLAALIAACDLFLTPFSDGVSTRRGSFMAGLCQGIAVLGTSGVHTDPMLLNRGLDLVEVGVRDAYADRAAVLARDDAARARVARSGCQLFEAEFSWDKIARRLVDSHGTN
jgi:hypothetical protein